MKSQKKGSWRILFHRRVYFWWSVIMAVKTITMRVCFCKKKKKIICLHRSGSDCTRLHPFETHLATIIATAAFFFLKEPDWTYLHSSKLTGFLWPNYYINTNHAVSEQKQMKQVWNLYLKCKLLKTFIPFMRSSKASSYLIRENAGEQ